MQDKTCVRVCKLVKLMWFVVQSLRLLWGVAVVWLSVLYSRFDWPYRKNISIYLDVFCLYKIKICPFWFQIFFSKGEHRTVFLQSRCARCSRQNMNFSWILISELPGFIKIAQDKCIHCDLLLARVQWQYITLS